MLLGVALGLSVLVNVVLMLPVVPEQALASTPVTTMVADVGETVGWEPFAATVAGVVGTWPPGTVVLTRNYGEAGALQRYAPGLAVYSGHNSYAYWGVPPPAAGTAGDVVAVGYDRAALSRWFARVEPAVRIDDGVGLDNQEQGRIVWVCHDPRAPWPVSWTEIRHVG